MTHLIDGEFQSDKYPTTPRGKVPLSVKDATAQDLLWEYARRRRSVDAEFSADLETALKNAGFVPPADKKIGVDDTELRRRRLRAALVHLDVLALSVPLDQGFAPECGAIELAREKLEDGFEEDIAGHCEGCSKILLTGDKGTSDTEGLLLCPQCAPSWADIRAQWLEENREEEDEGDKARFLAAYDAHIAGGGKPDDVPLYQL